VRKLLKNAPPSGFEILDTLVKDADPLNDRVLCFLDQNEQYLLMGTYNGLIRYDLSKAVFQTLPVSFPGIKDALEVKHMSWSKAGDLLAIVNGRPFRIPFRQGTFSQAVPIAAPFRLHNCHNIIEDEEGAIWISMEGGLAQINETRAFSFFYDSRHFLHENTFIGLPIQTAVKYADGNLYFGGLKGVNIMKPSGLVFNSKPPVIKLISLKINDHPALSDTAIHLLTQLRLPYDQNDLSFAFSALGSSIPALNRFAYRLNKGKWIDLGTNNTVNFSHLAPGRYTLQVKGASSDGIWNESGKVLHLVIRPPWWATWWAYLVYALVLGGVAYKIYQFQLRRVKLEQDLQHEADERGRLFEMDAFKNRFFTNITHEFRTPLTVILGMTDQLGNKFPNSDASGYLKLIKRNSLNLLSLINQILDLAKLESNTLSINYIQGDVLPYSRYIAESLHSLANARNVMLRVESKEPELIMDYNPERLLQIVYNLLSNAIKFTPLGGKVTLSLLLEKGQDDTNSSTILAVSDTGIGIPPEALPHVFDRFFQAPSAKEEGTPFQKGVTSKQPDGKSPAEAVAIKESSGTGIGLALTRELVQLMNGSMEVESRMGVGTTFRVRLPITRNATLVEWTPEPELQAPIPEAASGTNADRQASHSTHILLIEDNPDVVEYLTAFLKGIYRLDFAYNGRAGIEKALETVPDLIISDVMMPEKNGLEVCDALKHDERTSHIPIILLTAKADLESRLDGLRKGADAYLAKPFHEEELTILLEKMLENRKRLRAHYTSVYVAPLPESHLVPVENEDAFVLRLKAYFEKKHTNPDLSLEDACREMGMGRTNLNLKLQALTGSSSMQLLREMRLYKAKNLLKTTDLNVSEVAFQVGFNDPKYFSRAFSEVFGVAPSAVRGN